MGNSVARRANSVAAGGFPAPGIWSSGGDLLIDILFGCTEKKPQLFWGGFSGNSGENSVGGESVGGGIRLGNSVARKPVGDEIRLAGNSVENSVDRESVAQKKLNFS